MILTVTSKDIPEILEQHDKFIWIFYNKNTADYLQLRPSWFPGGAVNEISEIYPSVVILESTVDFELDYLETLGFDRKTMIWSKNHYRSFIITVEDGQVTRHSIGECFCAETFVDFVVKMYPELFEPPSVG
jgi:hypothetical protein